MDDEDDGREPEPCWVCLGDGAFDLYEEDPIFYQPGQSAICSECGGSGVL